VADKDDKDLTAKIVGTLVATGATFAARKLITVAWTQATGKKPPARPEDPQVGLAEALTWAIVTGVTAQATRLLVTRALARKRSPHGSEEAAQTAS
jgi:NhaP-type Na+/H+ or K+/H+ antiporter